MAANAALYTAIPAAVAASYNALGASPEYVTTANGFGIIGAGLGTAFAAAASFVSQVPGISSQPMGGRQTLFAMAALGLIGSVSGHALVTAGSAATHTVEAVASVLHEPATPNIR